MLSQLKKIFGGRSVLVSSEVEEHNQKGSRLLMRYIKKEIYRNSRSKEELRYEYHTIPVMKGVSFDTASAKSMAFCGKNVFGKRIHYDLVNKEKGTRTGLDEVRFLDDSWLIESVEYRG